VLPTSRDDVLYHFEPTTRDCSEQGRAISTAKTPRGNIYRWNGDTGHEVSVTAAAPGAPDHTCSFRVIPVGKSLFFSVPPLPSLQCFDAVSWAAGRAFGL